MHARVLVALSLLLTVGCTSHEGTDTKPQPQPRADSTPEPEPEPEPEPPKVVAKASIASVLMIEDCPQHDPPPAPAQPAAGSMAKPMQAPRAVPASPPADMEIAAGDSIDGWDPPTICTQSTMQLVFSGQGDEPGSVSIREVRVKTPTGSVTIREVRVKTPTGSDLATIQARAPSLWKGGAYTPWDEVVPAGGEVKASYRLSVPDWSALETKLGGSSYGPMFVLEVDVEIDGQRQTVRSPEFPRERPHVIVT